MPTYCIIFYDKTRMNFKCIPELIVYMALLRLKYNFK